MFKKIGYGLVFCLAVGWYLYGQFRHYEMDIDHQKLVQNFNNLTVTKISHSVICLDKEPIKSISPFERLNNCAKKITFNERIDLDDLMSNIKKWRRFQESHPEPVVLYSLYIFLIGEKSFYYFDIYEDYRDKKVGISGDFGTLTKTTAVGNLGYYRSDEIVNWIENQIKTHPIDKREPTP